MSESTLRATITLVLMASALALAGCGAGTGAPGPSSSSSPSDGAAPSPAPTMTGTEPAQPTADPADFTTWAISEQGIGPARIGEAFSDATTGLPAWKVDPACSWTAYLSSEDQSVNGYFARDSDTKDGAITTVAFEALADSVVPADGPRSAEGIGLGSTRDEVMTAYPEAVVQQPTIGDGELLRVGAQGAAAIYFAIREGAAAVSSVTVTDRDEPPYEVCA
ncbi:MAG: hypothetical protein WBA87_13865 [Microbacterium sp.]